MRKSIIIAYLMIPCLFVNGFMLFAADKPVAKVGSVTITPFELAREEQKLLPFNVSFHKGVSKSKLDSMRLEALNKLIERAYKVNFALQEELSISKTVLEESIASYRKKFGNQDDFEKSLGDEKYSDFKLSVYRELLAGLAEKKYVDEKVSISEMSIKKYYEDNKSTYMRPKQFKASHIMIKIDPSSNVQEKADIEKRATDLYLRAKAGEDFYNLAYYNSDDRSKYVGGDLGYFHVGQTVKEFEEQVLKMKAGEISPPVKTMYGYHIIKLIEVNDSRQLSYDEVKDKIRILLEKNERGKIYKVWMDGLKEKYPVEHY